MCEGNNNVVPDLTKTHGTLKASKSGAFEVHPSTQALKVSACVGAKYTNGRICVNFPVVGEICFSVSLPIPNNASVKVCMETCGFRIGIPPFNGIKATVYVQDAPMWSGVIYGSC